MQNLSNSRVLAARLENVLAPEAVQVGCDGTGPVPYFVREKGGDRDHCGLVYRKDIVAPDALLRMDDCALRTEALRQLRVYDPEA